MGILKDKFGQACVERFNQGIYQAIFVHTGSQYMTDTLKKPQIFQKGLTVELKTDGNAGAFRKGLYVGGGQVVPEGSRFAKHGHWLQIAHAAVTVAVSIGKTHDLSRDQKIKIAGNFGHADQILVPFKDNQLGNVGQRRVHVLLQVEFINIAVDQFFRRYFFHGGSS